VTVKIVHRTIFYSRVQGTNIWSDIGSLYATVKIVHWSEIHHKSSPPRGWDGCTFVGADLRVCGLWVRSRSLAANHAGGPGYILLPA
jgi:hypothetical protein